MPGSLIWGPLLVAGVAVSMLAAGCAGGSGRALQPTPEVRASGLGPCSTAVAQEAPLANVHTAMVRVGGTPFGVAVSPDGGWSFVSIGGQVAVLSDHHSTPTVVRQIQLPNTDGSFGRGAGEVLSRDGRYLLVADGDGAAVIDTDRAEVGSTHPVLGTITVPEASRGRSPGFGSAIEVTTSADGRFAFVSLEYADEIAVFNLHAALASNLRGSGFVGTITLGRAVVGMAVSGDGRWLYATSELAAGAHPSPLKLKGGEAGRYGTVSVIDVRRAETDPASAVVATAPAGCGAVRVAVSPDGSVVWVTARESDDLLAFSAPRLRSDPKNALLARVRVGEAPVGLALLDQGRYLAVADSNRFMFPGATAALTIVDTNAALAGKPALLGTVPTGIFPRELAVEPSAKTVLVTNFASGQLELIDLSHHL
jgi:DNA-binding beta-propeller fold protein YncE